MQTDASVYYAFYRTITHVTHQIIDSRHLTSPDSLAISVIIGFISSRWTDTYGKNTFIEVLISSGPLRYHNIRTSTLDKY